MPPKTLYVSDLDGTLLKNDQTLSKYTIDTLNTLIERGMIFSYATARSIVSASKATAGLNSKIPVILHNGAFVIENRENILLSGAFSSEEAAEILDTLLTHQLYPIVYSMLNGTEKFSYLPDRETRGMKIFNDTRRGDIRNHPVKTPEDLYHGEIFHITCIDEESSLRPLYERLDSQYRCVFHRDIYSGEQWLDIQPKTATKAQAITALKSMLGCDRIICFGDGKNDISMFQIADEGYAVENSDEELKRIATAVIESNERDGVAKWLTEHFRQA